jgi:hypothetical protein
MTMTPATNLPPVPLTPMMTFYRDQFIRPGDSGGKFAAIVDVADGRISTGVNLKSKIKWR